MSLINTSFTYTPPHGSPTTTVNQVFDTTIGYTYVEVPNTAPPTGPSTSAVTVVNASGSTIQTIADPVGSVWAAFVAAA
jgi:hypothetical protein